MAVALRSPEDSNDLWDTCPLLFPCPLEWVTEPQTGSSNPPRTGLTQQLFQRRHRRSLDLYQMKRDHFRFIEVDARWVRYELIIWLINARSYYS